MTPEERFDRIEHLLQTTAEERALQQEQLRQQQEQFRLQQEQLGRFGQEIDKHNEAIRSLIVVGRTCLDSIKELRDAQAASEEKLNILVDTVDRIIRRENHS
jgi:hypothetical protein